MRPIFAITAPDTIVDAYTLPVSELYEMLDPMGWVNDEGGPAEPLEADIGRSIIRRYIQEKGG